MTLASQLIVRSPETPRKMLPMCEVMGKATDGHLRCGCRALTKDEAAVGGGGGGGGGWGGGLGGRKGGQASCEVIAIKVRLGHWGDTRSVWYYPTIARFERRLPVFTLLPVSGIKITII